MYPKMWLCAPRLGKLHASVSTSPTSPGGEAVVLDAEQRSDSGGRSRASAWSTTNGLAAGAVRTHCSTLAACLLQRYLEACTIKRVTNCWGNELPLVALLGTVNVLLTNLTLLPFWRRLQMAPTSAAISLSGIWVISLASIFLTKAF